MLFGVMRRWWRTPLAINPIAADSRHGKGDVLPCVLILSSSKRNQNFYRDLELARQTRAVFLTEAFDFESYGWNIDRVAIALFGRAPDWIFLNYSQAYTWRLQGFDRLSSPVFGFVGDHYNFLETGPAAITKQTFFRQIPLVALVTAYPNTNNAVAEALGKPNLPFIYLPWAIDPSIFHDLGRHRRYDIACMGALTEGKYPFRRQVRAWLEAQRSLRLYGKKRVKGASGSDHDGEAFNRALNDVRAVFSCASSMNYVLMKYFEIPAAGALLFGERTVELDCLGFVDGDNYIAVTPDNFAERMQACLKGADRDLGEVVRQRGMEFVRENHTWEKRIVGFLEDVRQVL